MTHGVWETAGHPGDSVYPWRPTADCDVGLGLGLGLGFWGGRGWEELFGLPRGKTTRAILGLWPEL